MAAKRMAPPAKRPALKQKAQQAGMSNTDYARATADKTGPDGDESRAYMSTLKKIAPGKRR